MIKHVYWEEFTKIVGNQQFYDFVETDNNVVLFVTDWSFPSRLALKKIKKMHFDKKRCGIVDVDLVDSNDLVQQFQISSVPFCLLFKEGIAVQQLAGFRVEQFLEMFSPLLAEYKPPSKITIDHCPQSHPLELKFELPVECYPQGYFYCNKCKKIQRCAEKKPVAHCQLCDYDLCIECQSDK